MSSVQSPHPLSEIQFHFPSTAPSLLPPRLDDWWKAVPGIVPGERAPPLQSLELPKDKQVTLASNVRAVWDKSSNTLTPRLALPGLVLGIIFTLVGTSACVTILSGVELPGMEFILKNVPVSLAFSLSILKGGLHSINSGIVASRKDNRLRQDNNLAYQKLRIQETTIPLDQREAWKSSEKIKQSQEVLRKDKTLVQSLSLSQTLGPNTLYAKRYLDINSSLINDKVLEVQKMLKRFPSLELPAVHAPERLATHAPERPYNEASKSKAMPEGFLNKVYHFFYQKHTALGMIDMVVGQLMLFAAIVGLTFLCFPNMVPSGLEVFIKDPYLSLPFSFILLGHWINCTRTGWRMLDFTKREDKRTQVEKEMQQISFGLDKCRFEAYCSWLIEQLEAIRHKQPVIAHQIRIDERIAKIKEIQRSFNDLPEVGNIQTEVSKLKIPKKDDELQGWAGTFYQLGDSVIPALATPSIIVGVFLLLMGTACVGMALTGTIPAGFEILTNNASLSIIFATTLLIAGFNGIYRGVALSDFKDKQEQKKGIRTTRIALLKKLFGADSERIKNHFLEKAPGLAAPLPSSSSSAIPPLSQHANLKVSSHPRTKDLQASLIALNERKGCYGFWIKSTESSVFWGSQFVLGSFLLAVSVFGLLMVSGLCDPPYFFEFIAQETSASAAFFFSTLAISVDTLSGFYRTMTYKARKDEDKDELLVIEKCYATLFPESAKAASSAPSPVDTRLMA